MSVTCQHILQTGRNRGHPCGKNSASDYNSECGGTIIIGFCNKHKDEHENEWKSMITDEIAGRKAAVLQFKANILQRKAEFEAKLEPREINYKTYKNYEFGSCPDLYILGKKETNDVIVAVDKIIMHVILSMECSQYESYSFRLYPIHQQGFTIDELEVEFIKRGFKVNRHDRFARIEIATELIYDGNI